MFSNRIFTTIQSLNLPLILRQVEVERGLMGVLHLAGVCTYRREVPRDSRVNR
jgi:hypothetical protein